MRSKALVGVAAIVATVVILVLIFTSLSVSIPGPRGPRIDPVPTEARHAKQAGRPSSGQTADAAAAAAQADALKSAAEALTAAVASSAEDVKRIALSLYLNLALAAVARVSAALLALYLVQILSSFTRYLFRMADHLDGCADALEWCDDPADVPAFVAALSPRAIVFGAAPRTPTEEALQTIRELVAKLPPR
jgi:hypothetical protein